MSDIIGFTLKNKVLKMTKCSFCKQPLIKGKYIQSAETEPAICFSCIVRCNELLGGNDEQVD